MKSSTQSQCKQGKKKQEEEEEKRQNKSKIYFKYN